MLSVRENLACSLIGAVECIEYFGEYLPAGVLDLASTRETESMGEPSLVLQLKHTTNEQGAVIVWHGGDDRGVRQGRCQPTPDGLECGIDVVPVPRASHYLMPLIGIK